MGMRNPSDWARSHPSTRWHSARRPSMSGEAQLKGSSDLSTYEQGEQAVAGEPAYFKMF